MPEEEADTEPKHPYVTNTNANIHFWCSILISAMSLIQLIIGIVLSEKQVKEIKWDMEGLTSQKWNTDEFEDWYHGDNVWIAFVGFTLAALGLSVWHTRSRANGIVLSVMLFISGFCIYPVAAGLGGAIMDVYRTNSPYFQSITSLRAGSGIYIGIQAFCIICWAFYTAFHSCCNSKVRQQTRLNMPGGQAMLRPGQGQQQVVYLQQPAGQQVMMAGSPQVMMAGGQQVMMAGGQQMMMPSGQQVMMAGGQQVMMADGQPVMMGQQPMYVVQGTPAQVASAPQQVQLPGYADDYSPPSYSES